MLLEKEFRRLLEILGDLGHIGTEFEKTPKMVKEISNLKAPEDVKSQQLVDYINFVRIPGYCAYQLTQEAMILLDLIAVKIQSLRLIYEKEGDPKKIGKLDQYENAVNQAEPEIRRAMDSLKHHGTLDGKKIVESIISG